jgi:hypothetical protein
MAPLDNPPEVSMSRPLATRFLTLSDIPALLQLESRQWTSNQAADGEALRRRLTAYPELCVGSFHAHTGEALASLFMKPISRRGIEQARCWADCAEAHAEGDPRRLFGISLTSIAPEAACALFEFFWPHALKNGCREIYLGSPVPGLRQAMQEDATLDAETYARSRRGELPRDAQLRYYHQKGFREVVAVLPGYFPHEPSLDHGVVLRGHVPLSRLCPLWQLLPMRVLRVLLAGIVRSQNMLERHARRSLGRRIAS